MEIRCNTEVTPEYAEKENADVMILAVGSNPIVPPLKGIDGDNVVIVNNYYLEKSGIPWSFSAAVWQAVRLPFIWPRRAKRFISWRCAPSLRRMPTFVTVRS